MIIRAYRLTKCGYYKRGSEQPLFGYLTEFWPTFRDWLSGRPNVMGTVTFDDSEDATRRVLCTCATECNGAFGVALWNEIPSSENGVGYIALNSPVGRVNADSQELPEETIPGWPSYLWFLPSEQVIVALIPDYLKGQRLTGVPQARKYFQSYLERCSPYAVIEESENSEDQLERTINGYKSLSDTEAHRNLTPKFETKPLYLPGPIDEILSRHQDVRKLVSTSRISLKIPDQRELLNRILEWLGVNASDQSEQDEIIRYKAEVEWTPASETELRSVINHWANAGNEVPINSMGVMLHKESFVRWFDKARGNDKINLSPDVEHQVLWDELTLTSVWQEARPRVEELIRGAEKTDEVEATI